MESPENGDRKKVQELVSSLESLSGKYGRLENNSSFFVASNDQEYKEVLEEIKRSLINKTGGVALFIGPGGMFSQLPDLRSDVAMMIDIDPRVLEFNQLLANLIERSLNPNEVIQQLTDNEFIMQHPVLRRYTRDGKDEMKDVLVGYIQQEAIVYGENHWSNPVRFAEVKKALKNKPIVFISADIANPKLADEIKEISEKLGEPVVFANLTNVHQYIGIENTISFIEKFPFSKDALIVFSSHVGRIVGDYPKTRASIGGSNYLSEVQKDLPETYIIHPHT